MASTFSACLQGSLTRFLSCRGFVLEWQLWFARKIFFNQKVIFLKKNI